MRNLILACTVCALLAAGGVGAETYRILEGTLTPADGGEAQAIAGAFDVSLSDWEDPNEEDRTSLLVDDFAFEIGEESDVLIGSADLMPRNLDNRVELISPVRDPACRDILLDTIDRCLADNTHAWDLRRDGTWERLAPEPGQERRHVQLELLVQAARRAAEVQ